MPGNPNSKSIVHMSKLSEKILLPLINPKLKKKGKRTSKELFIVLDLFLFCVSLFSLMGAAGGSTFSISNWSNCMVNLKNRSCVSIELRPTSTHCNCHLELHTPQGDFICRQVNETNKLPITTKSSLSAITTTTTQKIPSFC